MLNLSAIKGGIFNMKFIGRSLSTSPEYKTSKVECTLL